MLARRASGIVPAKRAAESPTARRDRGLAKVATANAKAKRQLDIATGYTALFGTSFGRQRKQDDASSEPSDSEMEIAEDDGAGAHQSPERAANVLTDKTNEAAETPQRAQREKQGTSSPLQAAPASEAAPPAAVDGPGEGSQPLADYDDRVIDAAADDEPLEAADVLKPLDRVTRGIPGTHMTVKSVQTRTNLAELANKLVETGELPYNSPRLAEVMHGLSEYFRTGDPAHIKDIGEPKDGKRGVVLFDSIVAELYAPGGGLKHGATSSYRGGVDDVKDPADPRATFMDPSKFVVLDFGPKIYPDMELAAKEAYHAHHGQRVFAEYEPGVVSRIYGEFHEGIKRVVGDSVGGVSSTNALTVDLWWHPDKVDGGRIRGVTNDSPTPSLFALSRASDPTKLAIVAVAPYSTFFLAAEDANGSTGLLHGRPNTGMVQSVLIHNLSPKANKAIVITSEWQSRADALRSEVSAGGAYPPANLTRKVLTEFKWKKEGDIFVNAYGHPRWGKATPERNAAYLKEYPGGHDAGVAHCRQLRDAYHVQLAAHKANPTVVAMPAYPGPRIMSIGGLSAGGSAAGSHGAGGSTRVQNDEEWLEENYPGKRADGVAHCRKEYDTYHVQLAAHTANPTAVPKPAHPGPRIMSIGSGSAAGSARVQSDEEWLEENYPGKRAEGVAHCRKEYDTYKKLLEAHEANPTAVPKPAHPGPRIMSIGGNSAGGGNAHPEHKALLPMVAEVKAYVLANPGTVMAYRCAGTNENGPNKGRRDCKAFRISPDLTPILNSKNKPSLHVVRVGKTTVTCGSFSCPVALAADGVTIVFDPAAKQRKK